MGANGHPGGEALTAEAGGKAEQMQHQLWDRPNDTQDTNPSVSPKMSDTLQSSSGQEQHWQQRQLRLLPCLGKDCPAPAWHGRDGEAGGTNHYSHDETLCFIQNSRSEA